MMHGGCQEKEEGEREKDTVSAAGSTISSTRVNEDSDADDDEVDDDKVDLSSHSTGLVEEEEATSVEEDEDENEIPMAAVLVEVSNPKASDDEVIVTAVEVNDDEMAATAAGVVQLLTQQQPTSTSTASTNCHTTPHAGSTTILTGKRKRTKPKIYAEEQMEELLLQQQLHSPHRSMASSLYSSRRDTSSSGAKRTMASNISSSSASKVKLQQQLHKPYKQPRQYSAKKLEQANLRRKWNAAQEAREYLQRAVQTLPKQIQGIVVHNFGIVHVLPAKSSILLPDSANKIYPIGFSATWSVSSPFHNNRTIQCRCDIISHPQQLGQPYFRIQCPTTVFASEKMAVDQVYKPFSIDLATPVLLSSEEIIPKRPPKLQDAPNSIEGEAVTPKVHMGVQVRFDEADWYKGTILDVIPHQTSNKTIHSFTTTSNYYSLQIEYEDGSVETEVFPAEGIILIPQQQPTRQKNHLSYGNTPLEAWGNLLITLGLIDEVTYEKAQVNVGLQQQKRLTEAEDRLKQLQHQRRQAKLRHKQKKMGIPQEDEGHAPTVTLAAELVEQFTMTAVEENVEDEEKLLAKFEALKDHYAQLLDHSLKLQRQVSQARWDSLGEKPYSHHHHDSILHATPKQQQLWLTSVFRREKSKIGSTGNKRKIVNAADLLHRMDTFFNPEIEKLIEGLPGSELCPNYIFKSLRGSVTAGTTSTNASVVSASSSVLPAALSSKSLLTQHEPSPKQEQTKRNEKQREDYQLKSAHRKDQQNMMKVSLEESIKQLKRKAREEVQEQRKQQKLEEEQEKKKARQEERLARLAIQVEDRLFKEACFQREKVVAAAQRAAIKENGRRRNAAEKVASFIVEQRQGIEKEVDEVSLGIDSQIKEEFAQSLPKFSNLQFHQDVLRIWDFIHTFQAAFVDASAAAVTGPSTGLPSLEQIQKAVDSLRQEEEFEFGVDGGRRLNSAFCTKEYELLLKRRQEGVKLLTKIAVFLSKPLAKSVAKTLSSVTTSSSTNNNCSVLATFTTSSLDDDVVVEEMNSLSDQFELPVTEITWREVARLTILTDALTELMFSKVDCANILRGYRTGGHPNSKEAQRLRRGEDAAMGRLRQILRERPSQLFPGVGMNARVQINDCVKVTLQLPSNPSAWPTSDWTFFLHNILAVSGNSCGSVDEIKDNMIQAWELFQASSNAATPKSTVQEEIANDFRRSIIMLEHAGERDSGVSNEARKVALKILERVTGEMYSRGKVGQLPYRDVCERHLRAEWNDVTKKPEKPPLRKATRLRMGMVESLMVSSLAYKKAVTEREEYMATALKIQLKREQRASRSRDEERCDDEEDDEEISDDEDDEEAKTEIIIPLGDETEGGDKVKPAKNLSDVFEIDPNRIGKSTPYDDFCGDDSSFPEYIRRCLAVLRTLCMSPPGETFIYPVDPQANPRYYETVLTPMCLQDIGMMLRKAGKSLTTGSDMRAGPDVEDIVAEFARNVRLIGDNCVCYSAIGAALVSHAEQLLRIFERLLLDWVLSPPPLLPPLEELDDDRCVNHHASDKDALILICDGCEGKYNMSRLQPKMVEVPKGDWFCNNCINGLCWASLDQRVGCKVSKNPRGFNDALHATIKSVMSIYPENGEGKATLGYVVEYDIDGNQDVWSLEEVDEALKRNGIDVPPIKCVEAVAESPGYGAGREFRIGEIVPVFLHPNVSDAAAQALTTSTVFKDSVKGVALLSLCSNPDELTAEEWLHVLLLLAMKCVLTDEVQEVVAKLENEAADKLSSFFGDSNRLSTVEDILRGLSGDDESMVEEGNRLYQKDEFKELLVTSTCRRNFKRNVVLFGDEDSTEDDEGYDVIESESELLNDEFHLENRKKASYQKSTVSQIVADCASTEVNACETAIANSDATGKGCESEPVHIVDDVLPDSTMCKKMRGSALSMASGRSKAREDAFNGFSIKAQLKPILESFEEDTFSPVVDTLLSSQPEGLNLDSCTCPFITCDFCGLPDTALGSLLLRVPNRREWTELMSHATRSRVSHIIAEIPTAVNVACSGTGNLKSKTKLLSVVVRIGGKIVSDEQDPHAFENLQSHGMLEYIPRNQQGAQDELFFRHKVKLPHITGSLSAHECCAAAAHNSRTEMLLKTYRERKEAAAERDFGRLCGKTLPVGVDYAGRSYWKFLGEPHSLFICDSANEEFINPPAWYRYNNPETIASVTVCLGTHDLAEELCRLFPNSASLIMNGTWRDLLLRRAFPHIDTISMTVNEHNSSDESRGKDVNLDQVEYEEGEDVLVKSKSHNMLWNAVVVAVSKDSSTDAIKSCRVHYKLWSSRFDEWVSADRVLAATDRSLEIQDELLEEWMAKKQGILEDLRYLIAKNYLHSKRRARRSGVLLNRFAAIPVDSGVFTEGKAIANLKCALLIIEAALPQGSVDTSNSGNWNPTSSSYWRQMVEDCPGLASLMGCVLLLEDAINKAWLRPQMNHLLDCLPKCWKAISDASVPSIATRIWILDRAILYVASGSRSSCAGGNIGKSRKSR